MKKYLNRLEQKIKNKSISFIFFTLIVLVLLIFLWQRIFVIILSGEAGVKWRRFEGGTQIDYVYHEGMHYIHPWDMMYIYNVRVQQTAHEFDVLTRNGMKIHLYISIRYQPEYDVLGLLHQQVGTDYVNKLVIPEIESVLRSNIGKFPAQEVYTAKKSLMEEALREAIEEVAQRYVKIDDVIIKRVVLPSAVEESIQYKIKQKHLAEAYEFKIEREKKEAERKKIEAGGIQTYNDTVAKSLSQQILLWKGLQATLALSQSKNAKVVVVGSGDNGLPIIGNIPMEYSHTQDASPTSNAEASSEPPTPEEAFESNEEPDPSLEINEPDPISISDDPDVPREQ